MAYVIFIIEHFQTTNTVYFKTPWHFCYSRHAFQRRIIHIFISYWINHKWVIIRILFRNRRLNVLWYFTFLIKEQGLTIKFSLFALIYLFVLCPLSNAVSVTPILHVIHVNYTSKSRMAFIWEKSNHKDRSVKLHNARVLLILVISFVYVIPFRLLKYSTMSFVFRRSSPHSLDKRVAE